MIDRHATLLGIADYISTTDIHETKHGHWKIVYRNKVATVYECSVCGHLAFGTSDYCICGAKMDESKTS